MARRKGSTVGRKTHQHEQQLTEKQSPSPIPTSTASTPTKEFVQPRPPTSFTPSLSAPSDLQDVWALPEVEICMFETMEKFQPLAEHLSFSLINLHCAIKKATGISIPTTEIRRHLYETYDLDTLKEDAAIFPRKTIEFSLPESYHRLRQRLAAKKDTESVQQHQEASEEVEEEVKSVDDQSEGTESVSDEKVGSKRKGQSDSESVKSSESEPGVRSRIRKNRALLKKSRK